MPPKLSDSAPPAAGQPAEGASATSALSAEQFDKIVELLQPGYELSKLYLADYQRQMADRADVEQRMINEAATTKLAETPENQD